MLCGKTFKALVCQMSGKYANTKSEIIKHYQKEVEFFFLIQNLGFWKFKTVSEKVKPTQIDSFWDKPKALIRNVTSQPFQWYSISGS